MFNGLKPESGVSGFLGRLGVGVTTGVGSLLFLLGLLAGVID